jgi:hypothetical protein
VMIGTTRSRVSYFMNKFRKLGFIHYDGDGLEVNSSLLNVILTGLSLFFLRENHVPVIFISLRNRFLALAPTIPRRFAALSLG